MKNKEIVRLIEAANYYAEALVDDDRVMDAPPVSGWDKSQGDLVSFSDVEHDIESQLDKYFRYLADRFDSFSYEDIKSYVNEEANATEFDYVVGTFCKAITNYINEKKIPIISYKDEKDISPDVIDEINDSIHEKLFYPIQQQLGFAGIDYGKDAVYGFHPSLEQACLTLSSYIMDLIDAVDSVEGDYWI